VFERKGELDLLTLTDIQYIGCTTPEAAGNHRVDPRLLSLYSVFNCTSPSRDATTKIYNSILSTKLQDFPEEVTGTVAAIT
jgi:hypothetical protein